MEQYQSTYGRDFTWPVIKIPMGAHKFRPPTHGPNLNQKVECQASRYPGGIDTPVYGQVLEPPCPCQSGPRDPHLPKLPQRGAECTGQPLNLDELCGCPTPGTPEAAKVSKEQMAKMMYETAEHERSQSPCYGQPDINTKVATPRLQRPPEYELCPPADQVRPIAPGQWGGQFEGKINFPPQTSKGFDPNKSCDCPPDNSNLSGPVSYGKEWTRNGPLGAVMNPDLIGKEVPAELAPHMKPPLQPARVSCAPQSDVAKADQPSTFMRKLYEKYPYLYQILRDTPPEELIARVFKDRFLSTYQVDYLHEGVGKMSEKPGGQSHGEHPSQFMKEEEEGKEPNIIPGCNYRYQDRNQDHKKQKSDLKQKEKSEKEEEEGGEGKEGEEDDLTPGMSEYMASISKLGGEIIEEKLYSRKKKPSR